MNPPEQLITDLRFPLVNVWQADAVAGVHSGSVVHILRIPHDLYIQLYLWLKQRNNETLVYNEQKCLLTFYILGGI